LDRPIPVGVGWLVPRVLEFLRVLILFSNVIIALLLLKKTLKNLNKSQRSVTLRYERKEINQCSSI
jgi:hypothetical protein